MSDASLRILILTPRPFYPADTGGRIRTARILERIGQRHDVTLVCFRSPDDLGEQFALMRRCCSRLETVGWSERRKSGAAFYAELAYAFTTSVPAIGAFGEVFQRSEIVINELYFSANSTICGIGSAWAETFLKPAFSSCVVSSASV